MIWKWHFVGLGEEDGFGRSWLFIMIVIICYWNWSNYLSEGYSIIGQAAVDFTKLRCGEWKVSILFHLGYMINQLSSTQRSTRQSQSSKLKQQSTRVVSFYYYFISYFIVVKRTGRAALWRWAQWPAHECDSLRLSNPRNHLARRWTWLFLAWLRMVIW